MPVEDYDPLPVPAGCVDTPDVNQWLQNLNALMEGALQGTGGVTCLPVQNSLSDGQCFTLDQSQRLTVSAFEQSEGAVEKKIFLISARVTIDAITTTTSGTTPGFPNPLQQLLYYTVTAMCGGIPIATTSVMSSQAGTTEIVNVNLVGECVAGQPVEICYDVISDTVPYNYDRPDSRIDFCGAVLCISEANRGFIRDIPGFYCAPDVPQGCIIGREGIHLMQQNTRALCAYAALGYLESACDFSFTFPDGDTHVLSQPQSDVQYLIIGSAIVCAFNNGTNVPVEVSAQITGGCSNGSTLSCFPGSMILDRTGSEGGAGPQQCFTVPFIACGNCAAGGSIFAGINDNTICGNSDSLDAPGAVITSISQSYTVFTFRKVDPVAEGLLPIFQEQPIDKGIARSSVEYLVEKADTLFDYICNRLEQEPSCTTVSEGFGPIAGGLVFSDVVRPPSPPPPPPAPVPTSKTNFFCTVNLCIRNLFDTVAQTAEIELTISCPGAPPYVFTTFCYLPPSERETSDGIEIIASDTTCKSFPVIHTYNGCLVTNPVTLDLTVDSQNIEVVGSIECFSYSV